MKFYVWNFENTLQNIYKYFSFLFRPIPVTEPEILAQNEDIHVRIVKKSSYTFAEVWIANKFEKSINLNDLGLHGQVYFDNYFGSVSIDPSGENISYIAERKRANTSSFFRPHTSNEIPGQEYNYIDDWGEQMLSKSSSVVVILNWKTVTANVLNLDPEYCYGNVIYLNSNFLIGTMTKIESYRLGIVYTTSKPTNIFQVNVEDPNFLIVLNENIEGLCCRSPRISPDRKTLISLERDLHHRSHACCLRMKGMSYVIYCRFNSFKVKETKFQCL